MKRRMTPSEYALRLAETAALRSEDPKRQVGAALLRTDNTVAALGYNGAPPGVELPAAWWEGPSPRPVHDYVIHAEVNALRYVRPGEATLLASTYLPCVDCLKTAVAQGVRTVVYRERPEPMTADAERSIEVANAFGVALYQLRRGR